MTMTEGKTTKRYLSKAEGAVHLGISLSAFYARTPPEPDVVVGKIEGYLPETLEKWNEEYPERRRSARKSSSNPVEPMSDPLFEMGKNDG